MLGHEIVHAAARHSAQGMERGMLLQGVLAAGGCAARNTGYGDLAVGAAGLGANLVNQRYSREAELESDHFGMIYMQRAGYDPQAAIGLQETFGPSFREQGSKLAGRSVCQSSALAERVENRRVGRDG